MPDCMNYPKVMTLGSYLTERALIGKVSIQEKVDGSQFRFGIAHDGGVVMGSHHNKLHREVPEGMFKEAVDYVLSIEPIISTYSWGTYFFAEYLRSPHHNTLTYSRFPKNHLVLFDCYTDGKWSDYDELTKCAVDLQIDVIPRLGERETNIDEVKSYLDLLSYLGGTTIEGVVIKNYAENINVGGNVWPVFTKYVNPIFREKNIDAWKEKKGGIDEFIVSFKSEARWNKAIQASREAGTLVNEPKDIGPLIKQIQGDIEGEEKDNIKEWLYNHYHNDIIRISIAGFPEFYKEQLLKNLEKPDGK